MQLTATFCLLVLCIGYSSGLLCYVCERKGYVCESEDKNTWGKWQCQGSCSGRGRQDDNGVRHGNVSRACSDRKMEDGCKVVYKASVTSQKLEKCTFFNMFAFLL